MINETLQGSGFEPYSQPSYQNTAGSRAERRTNPAQRHWLGRVAMRAFTKGKEMAASLNRGRERVVTPMDALVDAQTNNLAVSGGRLRMAREAFAPLNRRYDRGVMSTLRPDQWPLDYAAARRAYELAQADMARITDQSAVLAGMSPQERERTQEELYAQEALSLQNAIPRDPDRMPARYPSPVPPRHEQMP